MKSIQASDRARHRVPSGGRGEDNSFGHDWCDDTTNVELSSGTRPNISQTYVPEPGMAMALEAQRILLGTHPDHGVEGLGFAPAVMNGISPALWWPYVQRPDDTLQFAHASHRYDDAWLDVNHPDYPA